MWDGDKHENASPTPAQLRQAKSWCVGGLDRVRLQGEPGVTKTLLDGFGFIAADRLGMELHRDLADVVEIDEPE